MITPSLRLTNDYARGVVKGKIPAGEYVRLACQRHLDDLIQSKAKRYPYRFDKGLAARAIHFIELLPHTKGRWAAKRERITLAAWQRFCVGVIFGWVRKSDGRRRFREAYLEVPRKNGKSVLAAAIGLYCLIADGEFGAEVYSGATTEKQAWEIFRPARLMAKRCKGLVDHFGLEINASNLLRTADFSRFEPLVGNPGDGSSPSCAIVDEYHEHKSSDLYDTMNSGMGARDQPLMLVVTTAGSNMSGPCYEKRAEIKKILKGIFEADRTFGVIYGLDPHDDWRSPQSWRKANPNLGVSLSEDYLAAQVASAIRSPSRQNAVKTKHLNAWVGAKAAWLNMEHWARQADPTLCIEDFGDCDSWIGLDLATKLDIAALISLFRRNNAGVSHYYIFPHFYLPEDALEDSKNAKTYQGWAEQEFLQIMDGAEIDFQQVQDDILALPTRQHVVELVYDPWQATQIAQAVRAEDMEAVEYRNTVGNLSPPMREFEAALAAGRVHHTDNPVLNWMASNVVARVDAKENIYPRKELPDNKIDGMIATLFAMGRAMLADDQVSPWEDENFSILS